jgi:hypothetical protein
VRIESPRATKGCREKDLWRFLSPLRNGDDLLSASHGLRRRMVRKWTHKFWQSGFSPVYRIASISTAPLPPSVCLTACSIAMAIAIIIFFFIFIFIFSSFFFFFFYFFFFISIFFIFIFFFFFFFFFLFMTSKPYIQKTAACKPL